MNYMRAGIAAGALFFIGSACGVSDAELTQAAAGAQDEGELGTSAQTFVVMRKDIRRCMAPMCGGWFVHDVNRATLNEQYVSGLDLSAANLDEAAARGVLTASDGEVVLKGKLGPTEPQFSTRKFLVSAGWRGMPGVAVPAGDTFYRVDDVSIQCLVAPCPTMKATKLNATTTALLTKLDVGDAALPHVQQSWLSARLELRGALASGAVTHRASTIGPAQESILEASQVFVKLPERVGPCPAASTMLCGPGKMPSMVRTADRCLVQTGCVRPGICSAVAPSCEAGYQVVSWKGGTAACTQWACDPAWLP